MARIYLSPEQWLKLAEIARYNSKALAELRRVSIRQLQREFRRRFERSPRDWLNDQRIEAARQRLLSGEPVKQIAFDLGFKHLSHFYRQFKSLNHMTTSEFISTAGAVGPEMSPVVIKCRPVV